MNPATAFGAVLADEFARCGLREAVLAPGSRSTPLALALHALAQAGDLRLHVRIDERSAAFTALGLAKASRRPAAVVCTSGTAAAHFHAAVIEADESGVPLLVLTADRPPELRGTGANQAIDQLRLYGGAVRWFFDTGVPEALPGMAGYWRSLACRAWSAAAGEGGGLAGPVHLNIPLRDPLVPGSAQEAALAVTAARGDPGAAPAGWPEPLGGRPGRAPWTAFAPLPRAAARLPRPWCDNSKKRGPATPPPQAGLRLEWAERGLVVCGDGDYDPAALLELAEAAGWPVLAEPSSNARRGPNALSAYGYLLAAPAFMARHQPDIIVTAGRPGLSRGQLALLRGAPGSPPPRHVVLASAPGRWADPARTATDVAAAVTLDGPRPSPGTASPWLAAWQRADAAARAAADAVLDNTVLDNTVLDNTVLDNIAAGLTEPRLARDLAAALPAGSLLWAASSQPVRDLDLHMAPRAGLRVLASRGASGIDGLVSSATGAALAHQADGGGPAAALLGDLALLHDAPGLMLGPDEPRPDLCLVVVNNDGGGIFSDLEQAALPGPFERLFGTPHGADLARLAEAAGIPYTRLDSPAALRDALDGSGLRLAEVRTDRAAAARLRSALRAACAAAVTP